MTPAALSPVALSPVALDLVALHLGSLHGYEKALLALIAFGPFVLLFVLVHLVRRRDERAERDE